MKYIKLFENFDSESQEDFDEDGPNDVGSVVDDWYNKTSDSFYGEFIEIYPSCEDFDNRLDTVGPGFEHESEIHMLETEFKNFPGEDNWFEFYDDLVNVGW